MVTRIGLFGAAGHMGISLIRAIGVRGSCALAGGCERADLPKLGDDLGTLAGLRPLGIAVTADIGGLCDVSDVIVDYSSASATMSLLPVAIERRTPLLVCTTGSRTATRPAPRGWAIRADLRRREYERSVIAMYELVGRPRACSATSSTSKSSTFIPGTRSTPPPARRWNLLIRCRRAWLSPSRRPWSPRGTARTPQAQSRPPSPLFIGAAAGTCPARTRASSPAREQRLEIISRVTDHRGVRGGHVGGRGMDREARARPLRNE